MTLSTIEPKENPSLYWFRGLSHAVLSLKKSLCVCVKEPVLSGSTERMGKQGSETIHLWRSILRRGEGHRERAQKFRIESEKCICF